MDIPTHWLRVDVPWTTADRAEPGRPLPAWVWGFGSDEASARAQGDLRAARVQDRVRQGVILENAYGYGTPPREEILAVLDGDDPARSHSVLTRNGYGAAVLNTTRLMFLDIDVAPPARRRGWLGRLFSGGLFTGAAPALDHRGLLEERLAATTLGGYRLYATAAGFRVIGFGPDLAPRSDSVRRIMEQTRTDPSYARLCRVQDCFRARLSPKHWRCGLEGPPGDFPREAAAANAFAEWLRHYDEVAQQHAVCALLAIHGTAAPDAVSTELVALHDRATRAETALPLA